MATRPNSASRAPRRWGVAALAIAATLASLGSGAALASSSGGAVAPGDPTAPPATPTSSGIAFPIQGPHSYGQGFGAARAGHRHQGQDVMAACGTQLVALINGKVLWNKFQRAAGNYLVIRGFNPRKQDYVYAHLQAPATVLKGQRVTAGQPIGNVGRSGDATACHLHFELWVAPGYYRGGHPVNPLGSLRAWDTASPAKWRS